MAAHVQRHDALEIAAQSAHDAVPAAGVETGRVNQQHGRAAASASPLEVDELRVVDGHSSFLRLWIHDFIDANRP